jgi:hypothetical protein
LANSTRDLPPLERLKRLDSEAKERGEISEAPVQVTDKADRSLNDSISIKLHDPTPNDYDPDLIAAGWYPKERCAKIMWQHPESGFYYSEEVARCAPEENLRSSSGRNGTLQGNRDG